MQRPFISVFFPAFNEEENIEEVLRLADEALKEITPSYELIVIDDGSRDATARNVERQARINPAIRLVRHAENRGYGAALRTGFAESVGELVFFTDADRQFDIREIAKLLKHIDAFDVVVGYRANRQDAFMRILNARLWNIANRILFGLRVRDIDCAFKLFRRSALDRVSLRSCGAMISAELLLKLQGAGATIKEVPVQHFPRTFGTPSGANLSVILKALREMWQLYNTDLGDRVQIQFFKFSFVGVFNLIASLATYAFLTRVSGLFDQHYLVTATIAYLIGTVVSFLFNRQWTFQEWSEIRWDEVARFYITVFSALLFNAGAVYVFVAFLGVYDIVAVALAGFSTVIWNFVLFKTWVFRKSKNHT